MSVSVLTLSVISIERWYAICHPLKFKSTIVRARVMILIIWLVGMAMLVPELVVLDTYRHIKLPPELTYLLTSCRPTWGYDSQAGYEFFKMVALYMVPLCLMAVTYGQIVRCLWSNIIPIESTFIHRFLKGCIFQTVTLRLLKLNRKSCMLFQMAPLALT